MNRAIAWKHPQNEALPEPQSFPLACSIYDRSKRYLYHHLLSVRRQLSAVVPRTKQVSNLQETIPLGEAYRPLKTKADNGLETVHTPLETSSSICDPPPCLPPSFRAPYECGCSGSWFPKRPRTRRGGRTLLHRPRLPCRQSWPGLQDPASLVRRPALACCSTPSHEANEYADH